jgi:hypothetical protein
MFTAMGTPEQDIQRNGDQHEEDRTPCGELGEQVGGATRAECCLRTLSAECAGEVGGLALLQEYDADQEQADNNVNANEEDDHGMLLDLKKNWDAAVERAVGRNVRRKVWIGAEEGT